MSVAFPPPAAVSILIAAALTTWGSMQHVASGTGGARSAPIDETPATGPAQPKAALALFDASQPFSEAVIERPLLFFGRRVASNVTVPLVVPETPLAPLMPPVVAAAIETAPPQVAFKGYVYAGGRPQSLLKWGNEGKEEWLPIGAVLDGWRIEAINGQQVILRKGSEEFTVKLYE